jgi:hypothetical protein
MAQQDEPGLRTVNYAIRDHRCSAARERVLQQTPPAPIDLSCNHINLGVPVIYARQPRPVTGFAKWNLADPDQGPLFDRGSILTARRGGYAAPRHPGAGAG